MFFKDDDAYVFNFEGYILTVWEAWDVYEHYTTMETTTLKKS
jgi:hypothetical protein